MCPENKDGMANSLDPDQTAPVGAVWSGSALYAMTHQSKFLEFYGVPVPWLSCLRYIKKALSGEKLQNLRAQGRLKFLG